MRLQGTNLAKEYPVGDVQDRRLDSMGNGQGLPYQGQVQPKKLVKRKDLRVVTLNVGSMMRSEVADVLERKKVHLACVQETKWKGNKMRDWKRIKTFL